MKTPTHKNPDFRVLFPSPPPDEIEAACLYEYMRESQMLRDTLKRENEWRMIGAPYGLRSRFFLSLTVEQFFRLILALQTGGFPRRWQGLSKASRADLVSLLGWQDRNGDKELYPPVMIEPGAAEFDASENCWRVGQVEPFELSLFKNRTRVDGRALVESWTASGRNHFFGFIRIDTGHNETEAVEAFRTEFRKHWPKTKGGGSLHWQAKLNDLVVIRLWKRFPKRKDAIKRVEHVAKFTTAGFKGCKDWWEERRKAIREKRSVDDRISKAANEEMSKARADGLEFFQSLFPDEKSLGWQEPKSS